MERLHEPPEYFEVPPELRTLPAGTRLWRIYRRAGEHPTTWRAHRSYGPAGGRFDHHTLPRRTQRGAVLYAALGEQAVRTAIAKFFQDTRLLDRGRNRPWLAAFDLECSLDLLDVGGIWPVRARRQSGDPLGRKIACPAMGAGDPS